MERATATDIQRELVDRFIAALTTVIQAIRVELAAGRKPRRKTSEPKVSYRDNGMPSITDGHPWEATGPLQYTQLLEPDPNPYGPDHVRALDVGRFEEVDDLVDFVWANPNCAISVVTSPRGEENPYIDIERIKIELQLGHAANRFFQLYGDTEFDDRKRRVIMKPVLHGFFDGRLEVATMVPIALVKFDFDRLRLGPNAYIMRMSDTLHRKRWTAKAYGASGHEGVLAAATHAFVITGWRWGNAPWMQVSNNLSYPTPALSETIEELFAALRLVTGVATGYAQELRLARGWSHLHSDETPEVYGVGARRYPEEFDNFGWMREDLPIITRDQMREAAAVLASIQSASDDRLNLAMRRMNTAMIRQDAADAILDAVIGLEILLSDSEPQAISYKLRLRAGALANLSTPGSAPAVAAAVNKIYDARSRIVHGTRKRKKGDPTVDGLAARAAALELIRKVLAVVLQHPRFLDPNIIDTELLLGGNYPDEHSPLRPA
ncbi:HEPN domain-containing protein [Sphingomonas sp. 35-24ZXX]|uniref:HEPN domain-containing protein n=1 Tax=Sphingomonas sp. 35-24ZXX TaxID=1545915 RepID=UPI00053BDB43|nr:HEPN domain-containing protein [Sphingomonas sp. 35-24ZXX]